MMKNLPIEAQLDIFKFLNFDQLFNIKQINNYLNLLIDRNKWILANEEFYIISLIKVVQNLEENIFDMTDYMQLDDELLGKWQTAINENMPLFFLPDTIQYSTQDYVVIRLYFNKNIKLKLPIYPKNIKQMKICRFWLEQLFNCSFEEAEFLIIFNSEMIKLLFENDKTIPLLFRIKNISQFYFYDFFGKKQLKFISDLLLIFEKFKINFYENYNNLTEYKEILLELLLNEGLKIPEIYVDELKDSSVYHQLMKNIETSTNPSKIVPCIIFEGATSLRLNIHPTRFERISGYKVAVCEHKNIYNKAVKFTARLTYENKDDNIFFVIRIKRDDVKNKLFERYTSY
uniref:F-box domain-containing protein n=1 Tax=Meloidogyne enterolobii TaxID=390850 RepID=A0A6V7UD33_MELEN|nr:unnamed protein product [Meloidogyne enterolobii]CAD2206885.1 unnamed protein product [Meloidogyne enterolobii]